MADLITIQQIKNHIENYSTSDDVVLTEINKAVIKLFEHSTGRSLQNPIDYKTDIVNGPRGGSYLLFLSDRVAPLPDDEDYEFTYNLKVYTRTSLQSDWEELEDDNYEMENERTLIRTDGQFWAEGFRNIKIEFLVGYDALPDDMLQALLHLIAHIFRTRQTVTPGIIFEGNSVIRPEKMPTFAREIFSKYTVKLLRGAI